MTNKLEVRVSVLSDVKKLSNSMRVKDRKEAEALGMDAEKALYLTFKCGLLRRTGYLDDEVVAMWGVTGTPLSIVGRPYLVTSTFCEKLSPIEFCRLYKKEVIVMNSLFPILENYVDANYVEAVRLLKMTGFELSPEKINNNDFYKFKMVS